MKRFEDTVSLVTGAASGIGRATAERLALEGAIVAVVDVDIESATKVSTGICKGGGRASPYSLDVADRTAFERTVGSIVADHGAIGLLVNNAGIGAQGSILDWDEDALDRVLGTNVKGMVHGIGVVAPIMEANGGGAIVNMASLSGIYGIPGTMAYTASKGAAVALTRSAAMELAPRIRVNAIAPGKVVTPMRAKMMGADLTDAEISAIAQGYPLRKVGKPEDIAAAVAFLGGPDAAFITGIVLPVEGGLLAGFNDAII